jgi:2-oxo-3-hexenedioate decarboxylase
VHYAAGNCASLAIGHRLAPRIEPEIVFKLRKPLAAGTDAVAALDAVEWLALGFEVVDCLFPGWTFQPADFVAAFGLHTALVVGEPRMVTRDAIASLVEQLPRFTARLLKDGHLVEEGCGKNVLRSPALCLAELANAVSRQTRAEPLAAGDVISSGSLTAAPPIASGQEWRAEVDGLDLSPLTLRLDQWRLDQRLDQRLDTRLDQRRALPSQTCDNSRANRGR